MDKDKLWAVFERTGRVEDYLRYCGMDVYDSGGENVVPVTKESPYETDHRRADSAGKQQYR